MDEGQLNEAAHETRFEKLEDDYLDFVFDQQHIVNVKTGKNFMLKVTVPRGLIEL